MSNGKRPPVPLGAWQRRGHYCEHCGRGCGHGEWWVSGDYEIRKTPHDWFSAASKWVAFYKGVEVNSNPVLSNLMMALALEQNND